MTSHIKKILYVATSDIHLKTFHVPYLEWLASEGHIVDIAAERRGGLSFDCVNHAHWMPFPRKLASWQNLSSYRRLRSIIETGDYDLIHCHTPIPSALTRIAARNWRKKGGKLLYTAHGFHFYRGAPLKNWLIYYPAEWLLSAFTDAIITINREDFGYVDGKMWHGKSFLMPGIGVRTDRFQPIPAGERSQLRKELGFAEDDFILLYVAEFIPRKNHRFLIEAAVDLVQSIPNLRLVFAGEGVLFETCKAEVTKLGLESNVRFLGFRSDVAKFAAIADVGVSSSRHEGLPIGLLEKMLCTVPVVASEDRGHREFVVDGETGFLFPQGSHADFRERVLSLASDPDLRARIGAAARVKALEFSIEKSLAFARTFYDSAFVE